LLFLFSLLSIRVLWWAWLMFWTLAIA
jgi:hypothetical protein